jgi:hypothetical protein
MKLSLECMWCGSEYLLLLDYGMYHIIEECLTSLVLYSLIMSNTLNIVLFFFPAFLLSYLEQQLQIAKMCDFTTS